jgi:hypothetical protein
MSKTTEECQAFRTAAVKYVEFISDHTTILLIIAVLNSLDLPKENNIQAGVSFLKIRDAGGLDSWEPYANILEALGEYVTNHPGQTVDVVYDHFCRKVHTG